MPNVIDWDKTKIRKHVDVIIAHRVTRIYMIRRLKLNSPDSNYCTFNVKVKGERSKSPGTKKEKLLSHSH